MEEGKIERFNEKLVNLLKIIIGLLMAIMVSIMIINVITRYFFHTSLTFTGELSQYLTIWVALLGSVILVIKGEHITVDVLENHLRTKSKKVIQICCILVSSLFFVVQIFYGIVFITMTTGQSASSISFLPMNVVYVVFPVSGILMLFGSFYKLYLLFSQGR